MTRWVHNFSILAIHNKGHLPNSITICQSRLIKFPNTSLSFSKFPIDLQNFAKVTKFLQIWSHCTCILVPASVSRFGKISSLWQKKLKTGYCKKVHLVGIWQSIEPTLANFYPIGQISTVVNGQKMKHNLAIWSHWCLPLKKRSERFNSYCNI